MDSDILKIIASLSKYNTTEDERSNAIGKEYLIAGKEDGLLGVVDEYGKVKELGRSISFNISGNKGEVVIPGIDNDLRIKYGRVNISEAGDSETTHEIFYDEPFPNYCQSILVTQNINDQMTGFMANPVDATKFVLTATGGRGGEVISYIAIGY